MIVNKVNEHLPVWHLRRKPSRKKQ